VRGVGTPRSHRPQVNSASQEPAHDSFPDDVHTFTGRVKGRGVACACSLVGRNKKATGVSLRWVDKKSHPFLWLVLVSNLHCICLPLLGRSERKLAATTGGWGARVRTCIAIPRLLLPCALSTSFFCFVRMGQSQRGFLVLSCSTVFAACASSVCGAGAASNPTSGWCAGCQHASPPSPLSIHRSRVPSRFLHCSRVRCACALAVFLCLYFCLGLYLPATVQLCIVHSSKGRCSTGSSKSTEKHTSAPTISTAHARFYLRSWA